MLLNIIIEPKNAKNGYYLYILNIYLLIFKKKITSTMLCSHGVGRWRGGTGTRFCTVNFKEKAVREYNFLHE